jgi:hypothetical protein
VIQPGYKSDFTFEAQALLAGGEGAVEQHLDGDEAARGRLDGLVDGALASGAEAFEKLVAVQGPPQVSELLGSRAMVAAAIGSFGCGCRLVDAVSEPEPLTELWHEVGVSKLEAVLAHMSAGLSRADHGSHEAIQASLTRTGLKRL